MTGPIIPADQWPEWADRHCWDRDGSGRFYGQWSAQSVWKSDWSWSNIPMPAGHDWRVPVMRPTTEDSSAVAPAIDLEQFREAVCAYRLASLAGLNDCEAHGVKGHSFGESIEHADRLLALIDGQTADPRIDLAADHTGMLVDYSGLIGSAQRALLDDPGIAEMLRQLSRHLEELGRRWYAGDRKVVDEFLQLYCIESEARAALVKQPTKGDGQAAPRPLIARPIAEWHEDDGPAMWWAWCGREWAGEPAWCGTPNDSDWPGYHTHWTPHPAWPMQPTKGEGE